MLYTGKGDDGTTKTYGCNQRISKSSAAAEALGALDEINSLLGVIKVKAVAQGDTLKIPQGVTFEETIDGVQQTLFKIQAEVAGFPMTLELEKVKGLEAIIAAVEKELPPITTFFVSGGTELAALFDYARTVARRAERRVVALSDKALAKSDGDHSRVKIEATTLAYLNRLSSLLYALARLTNHRSGITEEPPHYH